MANPTEDELEDFIKDNNVDSRAASDLRDCTGEVQRKVIARGDLSSARNPSAALLARIRDARNSGGTVTRGHHAGGSTPELEEFIAHNKVDESAADSLRSCSPEVQRTVIARGELKTARNPSSALLSRIRDAKSGRGSGAPAPVTADPAVAAAPTLPAGFPYYPPGYPYSAYYPYYGYPGLVPGMPVPGVPGVPGVVPGAPPPGAPGTIVPGAPPPGAPPGAEKSRSRSRRSRRRSSSSSGKKKKKKGKRRGRSSSS
ncbi:unnamed protein product [Durusdinium trenchii]|uniref:Uncharacterized protein n=2 Tax=Durusdinium trenchii TaxID=1381693 RepID=A0ABP0NR38_9DINO